MMKQANRQELMLELSRLSNEAFLVMQYPKEDDVNHKSRNELVHFLHESGYHSAAEAIDNHAGFLRGSDAKEALKVYHLIEQHSVAISCNLYYKGYANDNIKNALK